MELNKSLFGKNLKYVLVLALLTFLAYSIPQVKANIGYSGQNVTSLAAVTSAVQATTEEPVVDVVACPVGYICTPNPKLSVSSVQISGPNPQVMSYRFNLAGVDTVEVSFTANGSIAKIPNFSAQINGTRLNALGKTTLNTRGKTIYELQVSFVNKTGKDVSVGMKAVGYSGKKQVGADGDAIMIFGNSTAPSCPFGYTCTPVSDLPLIYSVTDPAPLGGKMSINGKNLIGKGNFLPVFIDGREVQSVDGSKDGTVLFFAVPDLSIGDHEIYVKDLFGGISNSMVFSVIASQATSSVPVVTVNTPKAGQVVIVGSQTEINWTVDWHDNVSEKTHVFDITEYTDGGKGELAYGVILSPSCTLGSDTGMVCNYSFQWTPKYSSQSYQLYIGLSQNSAIGGKSGVFSVVVSTSTITPVTPITPTAQCYQFTSNLTVGSVGSDVVELQAWLIGHGFDIPDVSSGKSTKGYFGASTKAAVEKMQSSIGVPPTGFVGSLTRATLNVCPAVISTVPTIIPTTQ